VQVRGCAIVACAGVWVCECSVCRRAGVQVFGCASIVCAGVACRAREYWSV